MDKPGHQKKLFALMTRSSVDKHENGNIQLASLIKWLKRHLLNAFISCLLLLVSQIYSTVISKHTEVEHRKSHLELVPLTWQRFDYTARLNLFQKP